MKLKRTKKQRTCCNCQAPINKGAFYGQKTKTITDKKGQCIGTDWNDSTAFPLTLTKKFIFCEGCSND